MGGWRQKPGKLRFYKLIMAFSLKRNKHLVCFLAYVGEHWHCDMLCGVISLLNHAIAIKVNT